MVSRSSWVHFGRFGLCADASASDDIGVFDITDEPFLFEEADVREVATARLATSHGLRGAPHVDHVLLVARRAGRAEQTGIAETTGLHWIASRRFADQRPARASREGERRIDDAVVEVFATFPLPEADALALADTLVRPCPPPTEAHRDLTFRLGAAGAPSLEVLLAPDRVSDDLFLFDDRDREAGRFVWTLADATGQTVRVRFEIVDGPDAPSPGTPSDAPGDRAHSELFSVDVEWRELAPHPGPPPRDAGTDAAMSDAGIDDAGIDDAGIDDAGTDDAGTEDAGTEDAAVPTPHSLWTRARVGSYWLDITVPCATTCDEANLRVLEDAYVWHQPERRYQLQANVGAVYGDHLGAGAYVQLGIPIYRPFAGGFESGFVASLARFADDTIVWQLGLRLAYDISYLWREDVGGRNRPLQLSIGLDMTAAIPLLQTSLGPTAAIDAGFGVAPFVQARLALSPQAFVALTVAPSWIIARTPLTFGLVTLGGGVSW